MVKIDAVTCIGFLYGVFHCVQDAEALMDPVTAIGVVSGVFAIVEFVIQRYRDLADSAQSHEFDHQIDKEMTEWTARMTTSLENIEDILGEREEAQEFSNSLRVLRKSFTEIQNDFGTIHDTKELFDERVKKGEEINGSLRKAYIEDAKAMSDKYAKENPFQEMHNVLRDTFKNYSNSGSTFLNQYQKRHANVCLTGMSPIQAVSKLLEHVAWMSSYYFNIRMLSRNLSDRAEGIEHNEEIGSDFAATLSKWWNGTIVALKPHLKKFSRELYVCNTPNITKTGSFYELKVFSKAFLRKCYPHRMPLFKSALGTLEKECASIKDSEVCPEELQSDDIRKNCILAHSSCMSVHNCEENSGNAGVCVREPSKKLSTDRRYEYYYKSHEDSANMNQNAECNDVSLERKEYVHYDVVCKTCQCICQDREYWVNIEPAKAFTSGNEVVTGAKIVLRDNILEVHIQRGKLLPNGIIDPTISSDASSRDRWVGPSKNTLRRISWDSLRKFHLSTCTACPGYVVTAMGFDILPDDKPEGTIYLRVYTSRYNFREGLLYNPDSATDPLHPLYPTTFRSTDLDVADSTSPVKVEGKSTEGVKLDAYVKLATSDGTDGGRSTVPFFDGEEVTANSPLSGAGLYWKGKNDTGGFIGIRLITYDTAPFLTNDPGAV